MRTGEIALSDEEESPKPLEGVRILAPEQMQALPYATQLMAYLGADVVKVEPPNHGEAGRAAKPSVRDVDGREVGATYLRNNLSKRSLCLDLKTEDGVRLFKRLVPHFDIVAENFKSETMDRFGLGYDVLSRLNPRLIYVAISGFGHSKGSPYADWPAYATTIEAMAGFYEAKRLPHERPRVGPAGALGDIGSGLFAVIGTLAALRSRDHTGRGQRVDVAMYDAMVAMADMIAFKWSMGLRSPTKPGISESFAAKDGYFVVHVVREHQFHRLAHLVGHPEWLDDPRLSTRADWYTHLDDIIRPEIEAWASSRTKAEASRDMCAAGIAAGPSNGPEDLIADPHVGEHRMLIEVPRPDADAPLLVVGNPIKLSRTSEGPVRGWPQLGQHTEEVLRQELGLSNDELDVLRARAVI